MTKTPSRGTAATAPGSDVGVGETDAEALRPVGAGGPLWTRARLVRVMALRFGAGRGGPAAAGRGGGGVGVDTAAAAAAMGVSRRTVQRWLHATHGRSVARIPAPRLEQLIELLTPSGETVAREAQQARYARKAIGQLGLGRGMGIKPAWRDRRWLEPHLVVALEIKVQGLRIRQLVVGRAETGKLDTFKRRGRILDQVTVPTRFDATVLTHHVLTTLGPWRFRAGEDQVVQGFTQSWLADAPATHLTLWAATLQRETRAASPVTPKRRRAPSPMRPATQEGLGDEVVARTSEGS